jgi:hypothetical protein
MTVQQTAPRIVRTYSRTISFLSESTTSYTTTQMSAWGTWTESFTLMIMANVDWNSDGFAEGSNTDDDDWKLWKRPASHVKFRHI